MAIVALLRTIIFYAFFVPFTFLWAAVVILFNGFVPKQYRNNAIIQPWALTAKFASYWILGMRTEVKGLEHVPNQPVIIAANHQSAWETFYLQTLIYPQSQVVKKQLMDIPIFGSAYRQTRPIAIDREDRRGAMTQLKEQGCELLNDGQHVMIFPEGTRAPVEHGYHFTRGAAVLAFESGCPIVPIAQDSGHVWLNHRFEKLSGKITVQILPPVYPQDFENAEALTRHLEKIIFQQLGTQPVDRPSRHTPAAAH